MRVKILPDEITIEVEPGVTALEAVQIAGVSIASPCGGKGLCGKCKVKIEPATHVSDADREFLTETELAEGVRLACRAYLWQESEITILPESRREARKILEESEAQAGEFAPEIRSVKIELKTPSHVGESFTGVVSEALGEEVEFSFHSIKKIPFILPGKKVKVVLRGGKVLDIVEEQEGIYGAAFDIGTTTVVGMMVDLEEGREIAIASGANKQALFGDDVISRIDFAGKGDGLSRLREAILEVVNSLIGRMCAQAGVDRGRVYEVVVVGNSAMMHMFFGVNPKSLGVAPYSPAFTEGIELGGQEAGLDIAPCGIVRSLPLIGGFVGADTVAAMVACGFDKDERCRLLVDIGTNGEVALRVHNGIYVSSAAAGPAFEGAKIACGMQAQTGALERVDIVDGGLVYEVIGGGELRGICGTGLVDAVAALLDAGIVDSTGRFVEDKMGEGNLGKRLVREDGELRFYIEEGVFISQRDIRELQLAKSAIRSCLELTLREAGVGYEDVDEVCLAGAFGTYIRKESAVRIGLIPRELSDKIRGVGNAAGAGAKMALLDGTCSEKAHKLASSAQYIELAGRVEFQELFAEQIGFE